MSLRKAFNLDVTSLDRLAILLHGAYNAGKTHLQGDFLRWAKDRGPVAFLNIKGEDGQASLAGMGLGEVGYTVETAQEYDEALAEFTKQKVYALAVDSLPAYYRLIMVKLMGSVRYPDPKLDGERGKMLWGQLATMTMGGVLASRAAANYVMWVSPYDKSDDPIGGAKSITPDLPGKLAHGCAGWFDFVGQLKAETLASGVKRTVTFAPTSTILTRQRIPKPITADIPIPEGGGGWANIFAAVTQAFEKGGSK